MRAFETKAARPRAAGSARRGAVSALRRGAGFTLIEILVAITLLAIGMLGITMLQTNSLSGELLTREMDSAINLCSDALDRVQANYDNIGDYSGFTVTDSSPSPSGSTRAQEDHDALQAQLVGMHLSGATLVITLDRDIPMSGTDTATATVSWDYKGSQKQCRITSVIVNE